MTTIAPGTLLIAHPFLKDPNFIKTVICVCEHDTEGSFGFVINKLFDYTLDELIEAYEGYPIPVYSGGPVQVDTIHFLHQYPNEIPGGQQILDGVYWGGDFEILTNLIKTNAIDLSKIKFFIGYSGWSEGQLDEEIQEETTWLSTTATQQLIFNTSPDDVWKDSLKLMGGNYELMANFPIDPQLN